MRRSRVPVVGVTFSLEEEEEKLLGSPSSDRGEEGDSDAAAPGIRRSLQDNSPGAYHSTVATRLRATLHGKPFTVILVLALIIALFMPDLWVICGMNSNLEIDIVLSSVMLLFLIELIALSVVDPTYFMSVFFMMDVVGTLSMVFDISFLLGSDATIARTADDNGKRTCNVMFLRAARAARVGARAGRLSRILRYIPVLSYLSGSEQEKQSSRGIAVVISAQLANSVTTRVACLTIILVMVIPLFDIMSFPQNDYSLQTWVDRLSLDYKKKKYEVFTQELTQMVRFFGRHDYGPYKACHGYAMDNDTFVCKEMVTDWQPELPEPPRLASALLVHSDTFLVGFNMQAPIKFEAGLSMLNILFIIFSMVFSGLTLSNVVTDLAVRPLERMLLTVRQIASTVFKFSQEVADEEEAEEETYDVDSTSEMELLEKVVQKLAIIADLQTRHSVERTEDMRDEDIGILSMMQGKNIVEEAAKQEGRSTMWIPEGPQIRKTNMVPSMNVEDFGVSQEEMYQTWAFNSLSLSKPHNTSLSILIISRFHEAGDGFIRTQEDETTLQRFVSQLEKEYPPNPFHNFSHAVDVVNVVARLLRLIDSEAFLTELEQYALLIAAIAHDVGHPGVNNGFLSEVSHELALQYNDRSPLENMHCAKLYSIVANLETNVFSMMTREQYKEVRKHCIETILHTDMICHQGMVKDLQMLYQMNSEVFINRPDANNSGIASFTAEIEVFNHADTKPLVMKTVLHSADVSNPCRSWEVTEAWAIACLDEFFAQGDQEKVLGIPVQFLNDREKLNKPNSQIGFIEFMIAPFFAAQIRLFPTLHELGDNLANNNARWEELWVMEVSPSDEERMKVRARVEKVKDTLEDAKLCGAAKPGC